MKKSILYIMLLPVAVASFLSCSKSSNSSSGFLTAGNVHISVIKKNSHIILKNESNESVSLANWKLVEVRQLLVGGSVTNTYTIPAGSQLNKGASINYNAATIGFVLGADETVYLYNSQGTLISQMYWMSFSN